MTKKRFQLSSGLSDRRKCDVMGTQGIPLRAFPPWIRCDLISTVAENRGTRTASPFLERLRIHSSRGLLFSRLALFRARSRAT